MIAVAIRVGVAVSWVAVMVVVGVAVAVVVGSGVEVGGSRAIWVGLSVEVGTGMFVGVEEGGLNFVFYVYANPIDAMDSAESELQTILDSVTFHVEEFLVTPTPS